MQESLTIWVVDDTKLDALGAFRALEEAGPTAHELGMQTIPLWIMDFAWRPFPSPRRSVDPGAPIATACEYPDIVILDLLHDTREGQKLEGDGFYAELRKWENHRENKMRSFVVLWSFYQGGKTTAAFVKRIRDTDQRVIPLPSKQPALLKTMVIDLIRRIKEERENS